MRTKVADKQAVLWSLSFAIVTGIMLSVGFLPTTQSLYAAIAPHLPKTDAIHAKLKEMAFFPLFAVVLCISLPRPRSLVSARSQFAHLFRISLLPVFIAFLFGRFRGTHFDWNFSHELVNTAWYLIFIPIGEEFLFRGWLFHLTERIWPATLFTATNPFPISVWVTSIAFSLWHTQNLHSSAWGLVLFQVAYTFLTGFWLGYMRWKSGLIWPGIIAHFAINAVAGI